MLIKRTQLDAILRGEITLAFRRWKRATVKSGGTLKTAVGVLAIDSVRQVTMKSITDNDAKSAGFDDRDALVAELRKRDGSVFRIALHHVGDDPRIALRKKAKLTVAERAGIREKLASFDKFSKRGSWTDRVLRCLAKNPAVRAGDLAAQFGYETRWFKTNVRKLKALGLTESLEVGYQLSPRGRAFLKKSSA